MKILQIAEEEKSNQVHTNDIDKYFRNTLSYVSNDRHSTYNEFVGEENNSEYDVKEKQIDDSIISYDNIATTIDSNIVTDEDFHHDSDTESFYNIWGEDDEWLYNNELRKVVRNLHR